MGSGTARNTASKATYDTGAKFELTVSEVEYRRTAQGRSLMARIYQPLGTGPFPVVLDLHGGGWTGGWKSAGLPFVDFPGVLSSLSARGYVVASVEYRLSGEAVFPAPAQDVKAAIRWLRSEAYGASKGRLSIGSVNCPRFRSRSTVSAPRATGSMSQTFRM